MAMLMELVPNFLQIRVFLGTSTEQHSTDLKKVKSAKPRLLLMYGGFCAVPTVIVS